MKIKKYSTIQYILEWYKSKGYSIWRDNLHGDDLNTFSLYIIAYELNPDQYYHMKITKDNGYYYLDFSSCDKGENIRKFCYAVKGIKEYDNE